MKTASKVTALVDLEMNKFYLNLLHYEMNIKANLQNMKLYCADVSEKLKEAYEGTIADLEEKEMLKTCCELIFEADEIVVATGTLAGKLMQTVVGSMTDDHTVDLTETFTDDESLETLRKSLGAALEDLEERSIKLQDREDILQC